MADKTMVSNNEVYYKKIESNSKGKYDTMKIKPGN